MEPRAALPRARLSVTVLTGRIPVYNGCEKLSVAYNDPERSFPSSPTSARINQKNTNNHETPLTIVYRLETREELYSPLVVFELCSRPLIGRNSETVCDLININAMSTQFHQPLRSNDSPRISFHVIIILLAKEFWF